MCRYVLYTEDGSYEFTGLKDAIAYADYLMRSYQTHSVVIDEATGAVVYRK